MTPDNDNTRPPRPHSAGADTTPSGFSGGAGALRPASAHTPRPRYTPRGGHAGGARPPRHPSRTGGADRRSTGRSGLRPLHPPRRGKARVEHQAPTQRKQTAATIPPPAPDTVRIIPLGGVEEIGRNMTAVEFGDDIFILDCGFAFSEGETPGIDYILPNTGYLEERRGKIRGLLISRPPRPHRRHPLHHRPHRQSDHLHPQAHGHDDKETSGRIYADLAGKHPRSGKGRGHQARRGDHPLFRRDAHRAGFYGHHHRDSVRRRCLYGRHQAQPPRRRTVGRGETRIRHIQEPQSARAPHGLDERLAAGILYS